MLKLQIGKEQEDKRVIEVTLDDIKGSKTIENLLSHHHDDNGEQLSLINGMTVDVSLSYQQWSEYQAFIRATDGQKANLRVLQAMDYLDNCDQFSAWYISMCRQDVSFDVILDIMSETSFTMSDIKPYLGMKTFDRMIMSIRHLSIQTSSNTICWFLPLFPNYRELYTIYKTANDCDTRNVFLPDDIKQGLLSNYFILSSVNGTWEDEICGEHIFTDLIHRQNTTLNLKKRNNCLFSSKNSSSYNMVYYNTSAIKRKRCVYYLAYNVNPENRDVYVISL